ncbi:GerMN domain-containing protein [Paenactinomyces guangxiensis]|uniref:GerMN domain-containing protein n=1 Tax=Paenactinomyces guangxiensis TaxID=1490290 RepID=A0A7W1WUL4_9BACL|nr:GerMN domain-containing protein [Paenactinomyces guangxiensis]MBA4496273.1 GerMN domain-containing protein [Paenactinomyces guangxiensis]MBH8593326.1 GerMN domain-containing protein [Paenactinomyces guangxiensis]
MRRYTIRAAAVLLLIPLVLTGCLFGPEQKSSGQIDPPPANVQKNSAQPVQASETAEAKESKKEQKKTSGLELYFLTETGYIVPYALELPSVKGIAKEAMKFMVKGGPGESMLPKGFSPILPKGTKIKGLDIQDKTATVDFSKEFLNYDLKQEDKILSALTWTLTGFPNVKEVNIWVDGRPLAVMPKGKAPAQGLTRSRGINLEISPGVEMGQSMPVTLYFLGQTADNSVYYVPVTRMVKRNENVAHEALKELIKGPMQNSNLSGALDTATEVNRVQIKGDVITADFDEQLLQFNDQRSASKDALNCIVFSLTENSPAKKVKITVNGKQNVSEAGEKTKPFDKPVTRPQIVNPNGL